jgi:Uma2 family endonuclease
MSSVMEPDLRPPRRPAKRGEPAWEIATLFPPQGEWSEPEYLSLNTKRLVELVDGFLEVQPAPTIFHQLIAQFLFKSLDAYVAALRAGLVFLAPLRVRLWPGQIREPDVVYLRPERVRDRRKPPDGADLAMEVVSEGEENRERDLETKRIEYAKAKIAEYWIVDPQERKIIVLVLDGDAYRVHGEFTPGQEATSVLLPGFTVDVSAVFAAGEGPKA